MQANKNIGVILMKRVLSQRFLNLKSVIISLTLALTWVSCRPAFGSVSVSFFAEKDWLGRKVILEDGGQFSHVAISYGGGWLQASPLAGVTWVKDLNKIGKPAVILFSGASKITKRQVAPFLNKKYDFNYSWSGENQYCSKLVGLLLKITPLPMTFSSQYWPESFQSRRGELGLSPDDVYEVLMKRGYVKVSQTCAMRLQEI